MEKYLERDLDEIMIDLLENTQDSIYVKDKQGRFIAVSRVKAARSNTTWPNMIGLTDFNFLPYDEATESWEDDVRVMTSGVPIIDKVEKITHDGIVTWVSTTKTPRRNKNGEIIGIMGISRDITARHAAEEKVKKINDRMVKMLSAAKHDIRNRVIAIKGNIERLINRKYENEDVAYRETLKLTIIIEKILNDYLRDASYLNVEIPEKKEFDLETDIIDPILEIFKKEINEKNVRIDNRLGGIPVGEIIVTNEEKVVLFSIFLNIVENALRYAGDGIWIAFGYEVSDKFMRFNVFDTGPAIPEEHIQKLFETEFTTGINTTGKGLMNCRKHARDFGGDVLYEETYDGHPNFIILWPRNG